MPTKVGRRRCISAASERQPISSAGASRISTHKSGSRWRSMAAMEAKASGGQKALAGLLKGQSGRGGRTKRNRSFMPTTWGVMRDA